MHGSRDRKDEKETEEKILGKKGMRRGKMKIGKDRFGKKAGKNDDENEVGVYAGENRNGEEIG